MIESSKNNSSAFAINLLSDNDGLFPFEEDRFAGHPDFISWRIAEIPISQVFLLNGLSLKTYHDVIGVKNGDRPADNINVLLQTEPGKYTLVFPRDGSANVYGRIGEEMIRAAVYKVRKKLVGEVLYRISVCSSPDSHPVDVGDGYKFLSTRLSLQQKDLMTWFGCSQPNVSNKLRLSALSPSVKSRLKEADLSEKHGRALLNIDTEEFRQYVTELFVKYSVSSSRAEQLGKVMKNKKVSLMGRAAYAALINMTLRDAFGVMDREKREYVNKLKRDVAMIRRSGVPVLLSDKETEEYVELVIRIPKISGPALSPVSDPEAEGPANVYKFPSFSEIENVDQDAESAEDA